MCSRVSIASGYLNSHLRHDLFGHIYGALWYLGGFARYSRSPFGEGVFLPLPPIGVDLSHKVGFEVDGDLPQFQPVDLGCREPRLKRPVEFGPPPPPPMVFVQAGL